MGAVIDTGSGRAILQLSPAESFTASARPEVLVVGVDHMANRGLDVFNMKADDVHTPKRQAEIAQVITALKKFHRDWAGANLVSDWFRRNMRTYSNVMQLIDSPNERVLVIYGAGHLAWLRHNFENTA